MYFCIFLFIPMSGTVMILRNLFAGLLLWILPLTLSGQRYISGRITDAGDSSPIPGVSVVYSHFENQLEVYPQEKIHLHTDRDVYVSGEKIWFKAYVVDAHSHQYPPVSQYVYVELISPVDTLINRVMILQNDGMFYGNLPLTDFVPEGNYTLRAYTRYMENMGDDYFFKKNIRIGNLAKSKGKRDVGANLVFAQNDFDVSFYPEGGNLLEGVFLRLHLKRSTKMELQKQYPVKLLMKTGTELHPLKLSMPVWGLFPLFRIRKKDTI